MGFYWCGSAWQCRHTPHTQNANSFCLTLFVFFFFCLWKSNWKKNPGERQEEKKIGRDMTKDFRYVSFGNFSARTVVFLHKVKMPLATGIWKVVNEIENRQCGKQSAKRREGKWRGPGDNRKKAHKTESQSENNTSFMNSLQWRRRWVGGFL